MTIAFPSSTTAKTTVYRPTGATFQKCRITKETVKEVDVESSNLSRCLNSSRASIISLHQLQLGAFRSSVERVEVCECSTVAKGSGESFRRRGVIFEKISLEHIVQIGEWLNWLSDASPMVVVVIVLE